MKNKKDELGSRMKKYEFNSQYYLMERTPIAIRIDGKNFHTFTKGMSKPFDNLLIEAMQETMKYLCENIQGCVLGYTQSDEITLILVNYKDLKSQSWFDGKVQKISSISASMATLVFNKALDKIVSDRQVLLDREYERKDNSYKFCERFFCYISDEDPYQPLSRSLLEESYNIFSIYKKALIKGALFDSRCFNIPKEEVTNLIYWRQIDAMRNSIQSFARQYFSNKQLLNKNNSEIKKMLINKYNIDWDDIPSLYKWGSCCIKNKENKNWIIDKEIPVFIKDNRKYIDSLVDI